MSCPVAFVSVVANTFNEHSENAWTMMNADVAVGTNAKIRDIMYWGSSPLDWKSSPSHRVVTGKKSSVHIVLVDSSSADTGSWRHTNCPHLWSNEVEVRQSSPFSDQVGTQSSPEQKFPRKQVLPLSPSGGVSSQVVVTPVAV
mmetsp:Transcript_9407/g.19502  ORF Transcript_9407/g.19502 Transcript_9407/m.19502 type:complete len:143 (-) Transcript_9407:1538-1966(-)